MLTVLTPWNLASYIPFGGFQAALRDWMLAQVDITWLRPQWPHELGDYQNLTGSNVSSRNIGFDRLAKLTSIATVLDLHDLETISETPGHLEFHRSLPFISSDRHYLMFIDSPARMFAPFLFDNSVERRTELETAVPIYEELFASEKCLGILTPSHSARVEFQLIFPGAAIADKLFDTPWIAKNLEPSEHIGSAAPVFLHVSKPPLCDAFGRVSNFAAFDSRCASMLAFAAFAAIRKARSDARLIWLCPDWRQDPRQWFAAGSNVREWFGDQFASGPWAEVLSSLVETGSVIVLRQRPGVGELRRLLRRADFLLDFFPELDVFLAQQAMQNGCIPILPDTAATNELIGGDGGVLIRFDRDCYRWNALGFVEGFNTSPQNFDRALAATADRVVTALESIADRDVAKRFSTGMVRAFQRRYCRYDLDGYLYSTVLADFVGPNETRLGRASRVRHCDFTAWPTPVPEHRLEGLELVAAGSSIHGRVPSPAPPTLSKPPPMGLVADRFDSLVQHFADLKIVAQIPEFNEISESELCVYTVVVGEGAIDLVNGQPVAPSIKIGDLLTVEGWMTISGKEGIIPDEVYVTLSTPDGRMAVVKSRRVPRRDLAVYFGQPHLGDAGFVATIDTRGLPADLRLGVAHKTAGRMEVYKNLSVAFYRGDGPYDPIDKEIASLPEFVCDSYEGNIDTLNDRVPDPDGNTILGMLRVCGWTTISGEDAIVPDAVFIRIENQDGNTHYVRARSTDRNDLKSFFGQPNLRDAGFIANIDTSELDGSYTIGVSRLYKGTLERCASLTFPVTIRN